MEIVINWGLVTLGTVGLAWVVNSGIPLLGNLFKQTWVLSEVVKKAVAFSVSVGLVYAWKPPVALPDPGADPFLFIEALVAQALVVFRTAQPVYDYVWKGITSAVKKALVGG
jgi:hypothetical protein